MIPSDVKLEDQMSELWYGGIRDTSKLISADKWGMYVFGGFVDQKGFSNELFLIRPLDRSKMDEKAKNKQRFIKE